MTLNRMPKATAFWMILFSVVLAYSPAATAQVSTSTGSGTLGKQVSAFTALSALQLAQIPQPIRREKPTQKLAGEGMVIYRVAVNANGRVAKIESITDIPELQPLAEVELKTWHFKAIQDHGKDISWWSFLGVCYSHEWSKFQPCAPPEGEAGDYTPKTLPRRIYPAPLLVTGFRHDEVPGTPLHRMKGNDFQYPRGQLGYRVNGEVEVRFQVTGEGVMKDVAFLSVSSQFFDTSVRLPSDLGNRNADITQFVNATTDTVHSWVFAPISFCGHPVEAQLRIAVRYISGDSPVPSP